MDRRPRDNELVDALDALDGVPFCGTVWRIVRDGRDPTQCASVGGRWDDGTFDVLYTSLNRKTVLSEVRFHLLRGQPVIPSRLQHRLFELKIELSKVLDLSDLESLKGLGLNLTDFGKLSYSDHRKEYPSTQDIAEVAHFHGFQGIMVPSARDAGANLVIFCDQIDGDGVEPERDHGIIDWASN